MTEADLALIKKSIAAGGGLTHGRARSLLLALEEAREHPTIGLRCPRCGQANIYGVGMRINRGCDHCCCDWFADSDEVPTIVSSEGVNDDG